MNKPYATNDELSEEEIENLEEISYEELQAHLTYIASHPHPSKYKYGINWKYSDEKWGADIKCDNRVYPLGVFDTELEAAIAYNRAAIDIFGVFARLNEIDIPKQS